MNNRDWLYDLFEPETLKRLSKEGGYSQFVDTYVLLVYIILYKKKMGWATGFEPATAGATIQSSTDWATPTILSIQAKIDMRQILIHP